MFVAYVLNRGGLFNVIKRETKVSKWDLAILDLEEVPEENEMLKQGVIVVKLKTDELESWMQFTDGYMQENDGEYAVRRNVKGFYDVILAGKFRIVSEDLTEQQDAFCEIEYLEKQRNEE